MQIMLRTILCVLLKGLLLTKAIITFIPKGCTPSKSLQEDSVSKYPDFNFAESSLSKPTSLRAFVQFDSQFTEKINDIFVTLRWNQPKLPDKIIQGYQVQCSFFENFKETCDNKNITTTKLEHTVHNLTSNMTYYFRVRATIRVHTKIYVGPYTDLINVSTTHENTIPKLLLTTNQSIQIFDVDLNSTSTFVMSESITAIDYSIQENRIYWLTRADLMTWKVNENNITKIASFDSNLYHLCIDWITRNLYFTLRESGYSYIVKFDLTIWENMGMIKFDKIWKSEFDYYGIYLLPSMRILYLLSYNLMNNVYDMIQYDLDGKNQQILHINSSFCLFNRMDYYIYMFDYMNNKEPLIYWINTDHVVVTDINISMCNNILHKNNINDITGFQSMAIDKTNIYILANKLVYEARYIYYMYVLKKKYASLKSVNATEYVKEIKLFENLRLYGMRAFDKSLQPYPPMRCLTPDKNVYNFKNVTVTTSNRIIVNLPKPIVKSGCKKYNLPTTIYTIFVSCLNNNLNKSEKFNVQTYKRYYEIQNLIPFTEYKLKFTLSNFYFDQLSINPFESKVIPIKTNSSKLNAPENISVLGLTPTIAVVHWMPLKKVYCAAVTYEVHWESVTLVNGTQQKAHNKQFINMPKRMADGRFFTKINLSLSVEDYLIYMRVYPSNFSNFYNESLSEFNQIYSEPNNITLSEANINSMNISWISNINLMVFPTLEYKVIVTEKWQTMNYTKMNYNKEIIYHVENLQSETLYKFRLILRYPEYEENFIWPADERFIFSTRGTNRDDISNTPGITETKYYKYYLPLMLSFIVIVTIICVYCFYCLYRQRRGHNEQFLSSTMNDTELAILHEVPCRNIQFNMIYSTMLHYNPDKCGVTGVARKQITFTKLLGSGAFGKVFQGNVKNLEKSGTEIPVAIKMIRKDASSHEKKKFLKEAELMNQFRHKHILRLLAVCLEGDSPLLVLELMKTDLLKYLRDCRNLQASDSPALRLQDLLAMCEDVARGCCYLEELRFVHRDLACRNCLVSSRNRENRVIKIGDFGLARDIYKDDYYRVKGEGLFPIRWMAPESLMMGLFTSQSDVWSFGVLMWEITSLGEQPYIAKTDEGVINYVRAGGKLSMTLNCPPTLYQLMMRCWSTADARPNFKHCLKNIIALRENMEDALLSPVDII
ncbi:proto-oncogene tyrosine-protein kinase ROS-like [Camponotus floridanus]|uniref:proto-oncogene tyrosine-protein kinase ROS-like n=1 Tax=Camponotus floridanus TaxID=104421 RepID=UPI000DC680F7|nr:proto-oncogene tyrosine-protein kinase ROS-like [Camponotus floridanus]